MKKLELCIKRNLFNNFKSIRSKKDIILLLLESIKNLIKLRREGKAPQVTIS